MIFMSIRMTIVIILIFFSLVMYQIVKDLLKWEEAKYFIEHYLHWIENKLGFFVFIYNCTEMEIMLPLKYELSLNTDVGTIYVTQSFKIAWKWHSWSWQEIISYAFYTCANYGSAIPVSCVLWNYHNNLGILLCIWYYSLLKIRFGLI